MTGIISAHVMVALRPTISEALKMLEGDIDLPNIPDRLLPLGHHGLGSPYMEGDTFSASSPISSFCFSSGEMLR